MNNASHDAFHDDFIVSGFTDANGVFHGRNRLGETVHIADASKVSPVTFWRELNAERYFKRELLNTLGDEFDAATASGDSKAAAAAFRKMIDLQLGKPVELARREAA